MKAERRSGRKTESIPLWANTVGVVVAALIPVAWDIIRGVTN